MRAQNLLFRKINPLIYCANKTLRILVGTNETVDYQTVYLFNQTLFSLVFIIFWTRLSVKWWVQLSEMLTDLVLRDFQVDFCNVCLRIDVKLAN